MKPLIDADILLHEVGWSGQFKDKETEEDILLDFDQVALILDEKIRVICDEVGATEAPTLFVTDNPLLNQRVNKERKWQGLEPLEYRPGFRYEIAKTKPYKGTRKNPKPFHFYNLLAYMLADYDTEVARGGIEADDLICQTQFRAISNPFFNTIICSRDKDLRICPGWHYSWECGKQASIGPVECDELGWLEFPEKKDVIGYGKAFFYYQMLVGDAADNIPGLPKYGAAKARKLLTDCESEKDYFTTVKQLYKDEGMSKEYFLEQANLLWMRMEEGTPYVFPEI